MSVFVNGQMQTLPERPTLAALLSELATLAPFAVAQNGEFIPRASYDDCQIRPGDQVDIVHPASGG
jgi:sulfur carrier protein